MLDEDMACGKISAESLVCYCLSSRFSSSPMGWRENGLKAICRISEYTLNGHQIEAKLFPRKKDALKYAGLVLSVNIHGMQAASTRTQV